MLTQYKVTIAFREAANVDVTVWYRLKAKTITAAINGAMVMARREGRIDHIRRVTVTTERVVAP